MELERASKSSGERNPDRLSALPDGVICHVLSFLPTQRSVQTSVLAKRWRLLWAHVPVLDLQGKTTTFSGIVCTVLLRHKAQTLNTFRLNCSGPTGDQYDAYELETCIATVVERNVQNLYLELRVEVPRCLLTCKTLVDFTMFDDVSIPPSGPVSLPSLKKLHYSCSKHGVDLARLLSSCPVLEDLTICGYPLSSCNISSPTLKTLTMTYLIGYQIQTTEYSVNITAPALTYLYVNDCSYKRISVLPPASLVEADIWLKTCVESDDLCPRRVLKYVDSFCNVKCLNIWADDAKFPDSEMVGPYVRFGKLTKLQLDADWRLLTKFLQSADQLEDLVFYEREGLLLMLCCQTPETSESWTEPLVQRCACLLHSLKTVTIYDFNCTEQDCTVVRFILRNAQVLKRMEIYCLQLDWKEKFDALQRIAFVRRGSTECELVFCRYYFGVYIV